MKALKIVGLAVAGVVVLLAAGAAYVASQFDAPRLKAELARVVLEKKQRTLKIEGDVALSFWPNVGVTLARVSLSERNSAAEFAHVDAARVAVAVMPLFSKQIVVHDVAIEGAAATLIKRRDGSLNIDDLLSKDKSDPTPLTVDVDHVRLNNVNLNWLDEKTGTKSSISGLQLTTGRVTADTGKGEFHLNNIDFSTQGKLGGDTLKLSLQAPGIGLTPAGASGEKVTLAALLQGADGLRADVKLNLSGIAGDAKTLKIANAALSVEAAASGAQVKGELAAALNVDLAQQQLAMNPIKGEFRVTHPRMPMKEATLPVSGHLRADLARQSAQGALETRFDVSHIHLKFDASKFSPLALGFDLDIDQLDVDKYLPPTDKTAKADKGTNSPSEEKLDFSALKNLNLQGAVRIGKLKAAQVKMENLKLHIKANGGKLDIAPHSMKLYEGAMEGALTLDANSNALAVRENLSGIRINPLLKDVLDKDIVAGRGSVTLDVNTRGATLAAMKQGLNGAASLKLQDGAIKGINLAQTLRELKAKFSARQDATLAAKAVDQTDFSELAASFRIQNGVAHNSDLQIKAPFLRLSGEGDIDIGKSALNYLARASVVGASGGQGAQDLDQLKGLTIPVRVTGPFDNPAFKLEFANLVSDAAKARVEEKKTEVKAKVEAKTQEIKEQAKDKLLKGLFGK